jgi:hypothetical protein
VYVFDQSTIVKPSWVISDIWEAFWYVVRCGLFSVGTNCRALVVFVLLVVHAVPFSAEVGVLESIDMGDVDSLLRFELIEVMHGKWGVADKVGEFDRDGRSVLESVYFVRVQGDLGYLPTSCLMVSKLDLC